MADISGRPRWSPHRGAALLVAATVYAGLLVVLAAGLWLLVGAATPVTVILGAACVLIAVLLRPRPGRLAPSATLLDPAAAPTLYTITGRVAGRLGAPPPWRIAFSSDYRAELVRVGYRGRSVLVIGLPLWVLLETPERVAVLARCLADTVSGDLRRGTLTGAALRSMYQLLHTLNDPTPDPDPPLPEARRADELVTVQWRADRTRPVVLPVFAYPLRWLIRWQESLLDNESRRAARLADLAGARLAGIEPTARLLDKAGLGGPAMDQIRASVLRGEPDPLAWLGTWYEGLSHDDRLAIAGRAGTEPSTGSRIAALQADPAPCELAVPVAEWVRVDGELRPLLEPVRKRIHDWAVDG